MVEMRSYALRVRKFGANWCYIAPDFPDFVVRVDDKVEDFGYAIEAFSRFMKRRKGGAITEPSGTKGDFYMGAEV